MALTATEMAEVGSYSDVDEVGSCLIFLSGAKPTRDGSTCGVLGMRGELNFEVAVFFLQMIQFAGEGEDFSHHGVGPGRLVFCEGEDHSVI
jgi:hypothetical protein